MVASERSGTIAKRRAPAGGAVAIAGDVVADVTLPVAVGVDVEAAGAAQETRATVAMSASAMRDGIGPTLPLRATYAGDWYRLAAGRVRSL
jgi:hypothetical protein